MASKIPLASILNDPVFFEDAFWFDTTRNLAPLHNALPPIYPGRPYPLEPSQIAENHRLVQNVFHTSQKQQLNEERSNARQSNRNNAAPLSEVLNGESGDGPSLFPPYLDKLETVKRRRLDDKLDRLPSLALQRPHLQLTAESDLAQDSLPDLDDFVHLPLLPVRKAQRAQRLPRIPPLLQGLHEPPPDAGLYPPITSSNFEVFPTKKSIITSHELIAPLPQATPLTKETSKEVLAVDKGTAPEVAVVKVAKRQKWTELETRDLLLGVEKFGIGKWKKILGQPGVHFDNRSAVDLKDRFRTIRPEDYGISIHDGKKKSKNAAVVSKDYANPDTLPTNTSNSTLTVDKFLDPMTSKHRVAPNVEVTHEDSADTTKRKKRSHHHENDDLLAMGIRKPFHPSGRRSRQPFTNEEDHALFRGFERHGAAWQSIRTDPTLEFEEKRTYRDLRDRFRNRWPEKYEELGLKLGDNTKKVAVVPNDTTAAAVDGSANRLPVAIPDTIAPITTNDLDAPSTTPRKSHQYYPFLEPLSLNFTGNESTLPHYFPDESEGYLDRASDSPTTPVFLDRSIVDWARALNTTNTTAPLAMNGNGVGNALVMGPSNAGRGMGALGLPLLSFEHAPPKFVDPLATWRPPGGLH